MTSKQKIIFSNNFLLGLILAVFIIIALSYSMLTPSFEGPDEDAHFHYSIWIFNSELRPDQTFNLYTFVAQPLYYVVNSIFFLAPFSFSILIGVYIAKLLI